MRNLPRYDDKHTRRNVDGEEVIRELPFEHKTHFEAAVFAWKREKLNESSSYILTAPKNMLTRQQIWAKWTKSPNFKQKIVVCKSVRSSLLMFDIAKLQHSKKTNPFLPSKIFKLRYLCWFWCCNILCRSFPAWTSAGWAPWRSGPGRFPSSGRSSRPLSSRLKSGRK